MDRMLEEMSARQFAEWAEYAGLEPFGPNAGWLQAGTAAAASLTPWTKENADPPAPADFFPWLEDEEADDPEARAKAMRDACLSWASAVGTVVGEVK